MRVFKILVLGLLVALSTSTTSFAETYEIDTAHSSVGFSVRHLVSRTTGRFNDFQGTIVYDPANLDSASVSATISVASIDTKNERRDNHLRNDDFFGVEKYPDITFASSQVEKKGDALLVTGDLTMRGVTRRVVLPVEILGVGVHPRTKLPLAGFQVDMVLRRSDYGVNSWTDAAGVLGDEVQISIFVEAGAQADDS